MRPKGLLHYPKWVNPKKLLLGDVCFRRENENDPWVKYIFTGIHWIQKDISPKSLQKKSELREDMLDHNQQVRKTGVT